MEQETKEVTKCDNCGAVPDGCQCRTPEWQERIRQATEFRAIGDHRAANRLQYCQNLEADVCPNGCTDPEFVFSDGHRGAPSTRGECCPQWLRDRRASAAIAGREADRRAAGLFRFMLNQWHGDEG